MTVLEWLIIGGIAATILSIIFSLYSLLQVIVQSGKLKKLPKRAPKAPKKRKRWQRVTEGVKAKRKRAGIMLIIFVLLSGGLGAGTVYANFDQSTNLLSDDEDAIVRSYFLLRDFQSELAKAVTQEETQEATSQNIRYLATNLAGYASKKASSLNTIEGQRSLNRYYSALTEFVSSLNFGSASTAGTSRTYLSRAQLFHTEGVGARGYYVQVTDRRNTSTGWSLTLTQDKQFTSGIIQDLDNQELEGAMLSFGNGWANSAGSSESLPNVFQESLAISEMNTAYLVASASASQGTGVSIISFGASSENSSNQENTLAALTDADGNPVMDTTFNKQAYSNSAVTLSVPDTTKIYPVQYTTTLTWTLTAGPTE